MRLQYNITATIDIKIITLIIGITIIKIKVLVEDEDDDDDDDDAGEEDKYLDCKFGRLYMPEIFVFIIIYFNK